MSDDRGSGKTKVTARKITKPTASAKVASTGRFSATAKVETKRLRVEDLTNLVGSKTTASFARFVAAGKQKALTVHELTGLAGGRVTASFARFLQSGDKMIAQDKRSATFDEVRTVAEFDSLDAKLQKNLTFKTDK